MKALRLLMVLCCTFVTLTAQQVQVKLTSTHPVLPANQVNKTFIKVSLLGFEIQEGDRPPVNLAIVLDKSGSMGGANIVKARQAAINAIQRLSKDDIVSVVVYDTGVEVIVPATKITDKQSIIQKISQIQAGGGTALFAGVSKGAAEVRKFLSRNSVNRVILLSDGQANHGPSSPEELGELGASLIKEGISVSTIGLGSGYNEDLMARLASKSDGNHIYASTPEQLIAAFNNEFGDVLSVVAQEVYIKLNCAKGIRPLRVLGRDAIIEGQMVKLNMNQLYSNQEKFIILEVEVPAGKVEQRRQLATCEVSYANMKTKHSDSVSSSVDIGFSTDQKVVAQNVNQKTLVSCVSIKVSVDNSLAVKLRDQGKVEEAKLVLLNSQLELNKQLVNTKDEKQKAWIVSQEANIKNDLKNIEHGKDWSSQRKKMKEYNRANVYQQKASQGYVVREIEQSKK